MMGDGGISDYQLKVTLHKIDDEEYGKFVKSFIEKLFSVPVSVRPRSKAQATDYVVSRKELVRFCCAELGLKMGNKLATPLLIPDWIKANDVYASACVRGLFDTDGSVYSHAYSAKGKKYSYKKICFTSASPGLCKEVVDILQRANIKTSCSGRNVRIENKEDVEKYIKYFGFNNPKHLKRLKN